MRAEAAGRAFLDGDQELVSRGELEDQLAVEGLGESGVGDGGREAPRRQFVRRLERFAEPRAKRQDGDPRRPRAPPGPCRSAAARRARACRRRPLRRADSEARSGPRRGRPRSRPYGRARPRRRPPSPSCSAGRRDRRYRKRRHGSGHRRRPAPRGRWRSGPAASGSPRHGRPGRRRAAGRSNRSRRTACSLRSPGRPRTSPHAARRCRRRKRGRETRASPDRARCRRAWRR